MASSFWSDGYMDGMCWKGFLADSRLGDPKKDLIRATIENVPGELIVPPTSFRGETRWCINQEGPLDLLCDLPSLELWQQGLAELVAVRIVPHDPTRFARYDEDRINAISGECQWLYEEKGLYEEDMGLPHMCLMDGDMTEGEEYPGYWSTPAIAYRGHVVIGTVWRSHNDGLWKDSWSDFGLGKPDDKNGYCFWDDLGSVGINQGLDRAMRLVNMGLSKTLHYVNLKSERHSAKEGRWLY